MTLNNHAVSLTTLLYTIIMLISFFNLKFKRSEGDWGTAKMRGNLFEAVSTLARHVLCISRLVAHPNWTHST